MAFDYKKEYREFYLPKAKPGLVDVPRAQFVAARGSGDPNAADGEYQRALAVLYAVAYTVKMSRMGDHRIEGYFDFVVPPLEGFWWQEKGGAAFDIVDKSAFRWISAIRLPDFVTGAELEWAKRAVREKKGLDCGGAFLFTLEEGLCVQAMHVGPFDDEPATIGAMHAYAEAQGFAIDLSETRRHHEIYLTDARRVAPEKWKTVIRLPVRKM